MVKNEELLVNLVNISTTAFEPICKQFCIASEICSIESLAQNTSNIFQCRICEHIGYNAIFKTEN